MACCNSDNFQLDCIGISNEDTLSEQRIISNAQILCRVACGVFCRCSQCSRARCHHTLMALCAVLSATATASAAIIWGFVVNVLAEDRVCILFASNKGELIEPLNKNSQICAFSFIGECVVGSFTTALTVWFAIKARCGVGWKAEVWSSLVQLIVLMPLFLIATICATVITAGIQHTCESSIFNNFTSNTSDCAQLYFHGSTYVDSSIRREYIFLNWMLAVMIPAWTGTALLLILLFASMLSIMIHQLKVDRKSYSLEADDLSLQATHRQHYSPKSTPTSQANTQMPPLVSSSSQTTPTPQVISSSSQTTPTVQLVQAKATPEEIYSSVKSRPRLGESIYMAPESVTKAREKVKQDKTTADNMPALENTSLPEASGDHSTHTLASHSSTPPSSTPFEATCISDEAASQLGAIPNPITSSSDVQGATAKSPSRQVATKVFYLPCHYAPVFSSHRAVKRLEDFQQDQELAFSIVDKAGGMNPVALSLCEADQFKIFTSCSKETDESTIPQVKHLSPYLTPTPIRYGWTWRDDEGEFLAFDPDLNSKLEANYSEEGSFQCKASNGFTYTIDFGSMIQTNNTTKRERMIKYEVQTVEWQYEDTGGVYLAHSSSDSEAIERMYAAHKPKSLCISGTTFTFDFINMIQINQSTSQASAIRCVTLPCSVPIAACELTLQVEGEEDSLDAGIEQFRNNIRKYWISIKKHNTRLGKEDSESSPSIFDASTTTCNRIVQAVLLQQTRRHFVSGLITAHTIELHGVQEQIDKVMILLQELLLKVQQRASELFNVPEHWSPQTSDLAVMPVQSGSEEWNHVQDLVHNSLPRARIQSLERIQSTWLWEKYDSAKRRLLKVNAGVINEKELFHGTSNTSPHTIFKSEYGFDFRVAGEGRLWGEGAYFAVNASYSADQRYAHKPSEGLEQIILAKVLTGHACELVPDGKRTMKRPPAHKDDSSKCYDTVTGITEHSGGTRVYVVYDHDKSYPAYLITYKCAQ